MTRPNAEETEETAETEGEKQTCTFPFFCATGAGQSGRSS
jgi:hypothetical protein